MRALGTSVSRLHPIRILGWSTGRKWVPRAWWPLETSFSRTHQRWILGSARCWKWDRSALQPLESPFFYSPKSHFGLVQWPKRSWKCHSRPWNIVFSTSTNSNFWDGEDAKNWVQSDMLGHETSLSRLDPSRIMSWSGGRKWVPIALRTLETLLSLSHHSRIFGLSRGSKWLFKRHSNTGIVVLSIWKSCIFGW